MKANDRTLRPVVYKTDWATAALEVEYQLDAARRGVLPRPLPTPSRTFNATTASPGSGRPSRTPIPSFWIFSLALEEGAGRRFRQRDRAIRQGLQSAHTTDSMPDSRQSAVVRRH